MQTIYIVEGSHDYEASIVLAAFTKREAADRLVSKCERHRSKEPKIPESKSDKAWSSYQARYKKWCDSIPVGPWTFADYTVIEIELRDS